MKVWLRRAGRGLLSDGRTLLWSVAEGDRGRRWRSSTIDPDGRLVLTLLFEENLEGRFTRLELVNAGGMLTLHPEASGSRVDGNVVTGSGVRPIELPWAKGFVLSVLDSPIPEIRTRRAVPTDRLRISGIATNSQLVIDSHFAMRFETRNAGEGRTPVADDRGLPVLASSSEWPLEVEADR